MTFSTRAPRKDDHVFRSGPDYWNVTAFEETPESRVVTHWMWPPSRFSEYIELRRRASVAISRNYRYDPVLYSRVRESLGEDPDPNRPETFMYVPDDLPVPLALIPPTRTPTRFPDGPANRNDKAWLQPIGGRHRLAKWLWTGREKIPVHVLTEVEERAIRLKGSLCDGDGPRLHWQDMVGNVWLPWDQLPPERRPPDRRPAPAPRRGYRSYSPGRSGVGRPWWG